MAIDRSTLITLLAMVLTVSVALAGLTGTVAATDHYVTDEGEDDTAGGDAADIVSLGTPGSGGSGLGGGGCNPVSEGGGGMLGC